MDRLDTYTGIAISRLTTPLRLLMGWSIVLLAPILAAGTML